MTKLMIVESPNKVKKISAILGNEWTVAASVGHVRDLPTNELGVQAPDYKPQYVLTERGQDVTNRLKQQASKASEVYLATDPDREGEAIAWHLQQALHLKAPRRVTFDAITQDVITKAISRPREIDINLVHAQEARRVLDRLVGYQVSPVLSTQTAVRGLSAGRVQSPAVRLVVERERQIKSFKVTNHFGASVSFDGGAWQANWETKPYITEEQPYVLDSALAEQAAACRSFKVTTAETKKALKSPPAPFTTSTMLQASSLALGLDPKATADLAQKLFESGHITYHRTDSKNFSAEALAEIRAYAATQNWPLPPQPRTWKSSASAQEAHEAIRPTHLEYADLGDDDQQKALYNLIRNRAMACQLADAEYSVTALQLEAASDSKTFLFKATGRVLVSQGWKILTSQDATEDDTQKDASDDSEEATGNVPALPQGSAKEAESGRVLAKQTKPPARYSQAALIKKLETMGIGRPSTYPAIMDTITKRGYLSEEKKFLVPTEIGYLVVDSLAGTFTFIDFAFTKTLEEDLDAIAEGKAQYVQVVGKANDLLLKELSTLHLAPQSKLATANGNSQQSDYGLCPQCKQGAMRKSRNGLICTRYNNGCTFGIWGEQYGKKLTDSNLRDLVIKGRTAVLKGLVGKGKPFDAPLVITEEFKIKAEFKDKKPA